MMLLSRVIFRKFGWGVAALITPTVLLITGVAFFGLILFGGVVDPMLAKMALTPLYAAVLVGAAQNIFSKSAKYSLFDPCKEMAYIPLDQETQLKASHPCALCMDFRFFPFHSSLDFLFLPFGKLSLAPLCGLADPAPTWARFSPPLKV